MDSKKITIAYMRVSTNGQKFASQKPDVQRWLAAQRPEDVGEIRWYKDKATGRNGNRPGYEKLMEAVDRGEVSQIVIWRLDRISRSVSDLCLLLEKLKSRKVNLISLRENIDLKTASGRLLVNVLSSIAQFESELRSERILAGQAAAKAAGKKWGGSKAGLRSISREQLSQVAKLRSEGVGPTKIAKAVGIERTSVYRLFRYLDNGVETV